MDWSSIAVPGLFLIACLLAVYQSWIDQWDITQKITVVTFLIGIAVGLFLDDITRRGSMAHIWAEELGVLVILGGILLSWLVRSPRTSGVVSGREEN